MKILSLLLMLLSHSLWAAQDCDYHLSISNATIQVLDSSQAIQQNMTIYRGNSSPRDKCSRYRVFFSKGLANSYQRKAFALFNGFINYNLHSNINQAGILKEYADALNSSEYLEGLAPDRQTTYSNRYFVSIPGMETGTVRSGTFYDVVQASIYGFNESLNRFIFEETMSLTVLFLVPKIIQLSLVDEGGVFDSDSTNKILDFGILSKGQEKGADLRVVSNTSYQLNFSSQNGGALKNTSGTSSIRYGIKMNGSSVSLGSAGSTVAVASGDETTAAGDRYNLKIQILDATGNANSGLYQDQITMTAIAN